MPWIVKPLNIIETLDGDKYPIYKTIDDVFDFIKIGDFFKINGSIVPRGQIRKVRPATGKEVFHYSLKEKLPSNIAKPVESWASGIEADISVEAFEAKIKEIQDDQRYYWQTVSLSPEQVANRQAEIKRIKERLWSLQSKKVEL